MKDTSVSKHLFIKIPSARWNDGIMSRVCERETDRDRERQRETETDRDRETERQRWNNGTMDM